MMMIFSFFFLVSLFFLTFHSLLFSFNKMLTNNLKVVTPGPTHGFWPHSFSSPPHHQSLFKNLFQSFYHIRQYPTSLLFQIASVFPSIYTLTDAHQ